MTETTTPTGAEPPADERHRVEHQADGADSPAAAAEARTELPGTAAARSSRTPVPARIPCRGRSYGTIRSRSPQSATPSRLRPSQRPGRAPRSPAALTRKALPVPYYRRPLSRRGAR
ncbi:hypothetical protein [Streptomyces sp. NPDC001108]